MTTGGPPAVPPTTGVVTTVRAAGAYDVVTLTVPVPEAGTWAAARPGQLVVVPVDPARGSVLPEVHWLAGVHADPVHGTSLELVLDAGRGTAPGDGVRLLGPLGRGFSPPSTPVPVVLVGHEAGAVPLRWLVALVRERGCAAHVVLSASEPERHLDLVHLRRHARAVVLARPQDLPTALERVLDDPDVGAAVVYAAAPVPVLRRIAGLALARRLPVRAAALDVDGPAPVCGTGLCGGCDLEVPDAAGTRVLRPCLEGPVVRGELLVGEGGR